MKFQAKPKYLNISFCAFLVICASIVVYMLLNNLPYLAEIMRKIINILSPFLWGFALAYILNYPYRGLVKKLSGIKKIKKGAVKGISLVITYILFVVIVGAFFYFFVPHIINAIIGFANVIPTYVTKIRVGSFDFIANYLKLYNVSQDEVYNTMNTLFSDLTSGFDLPNIMSKIVNVLLSITEGLKNFVIGLVISVYLLIDKERFKRAGQKLITVIFSKDTSRRIFYILDLTDRTFGSFVIANVLDSFIIGCICYLGMILLRLDYAILISVIVGITNIIPFFGPFIGAIPSALLLFLVRPLEAFVFVIFIFILQQFDGNILKPKLFGDTLGIRAVFVIFAVLIGGGMFGVLGMFAGVPVFAVIYAVLSAIIDKKYEEKNSLEGKNEL